MRGFILDELVSRAAADAENDGGVFCREHRFAALRTVDLPEQIGIVNDDLPLRFD